MRSWYDGLGSGRGRLLGPPKLGPIGPDASQDHGDLAGYGDTRLLRSDAPPQPRSPCLEGRPALRFREKDVGSLIKAGAGKSVPAFRYPALPVCFSGLIPSRRQSEIGTDIPSPLEPVRFIDRGAECKGCYRPDARHRHEPSQRQVVADKTTDLLVQSRHLGNGNLRTSINLSMSADRTGWSWASIRARWAKAPLLPRPTTRPKVFRIPRI